MNPTVGTDSYNFFFAAAPFVILAAILAVTYVVKRREWASNVPIGQSYACANCGRHGHRDQMLPQQHDGAVGWYCARCAGAR